MLLWNDFFLNFQWIHWSEMTLLYLNFEVWGVTDWAFSISGSNCSHTVVLCHFPCFFAQLSPPATNSQIRILVKGSWIKCLISLIHLFWVTSLCWQCDNSCWLWIVTPDWDSPCFGAGTGSESCSSKDDGVQYSGELSRTSSFIKHNATGSKISAIIWILSLKVLCFSIVLNGVMRSALLIKLS